MIPYVVWSAWTATNLAFGGRVEEDLPELAVVIRTSAIEAWVPPSDSYPHKKNDLIEAIHTKPKMMCSKAQVPKRTPSSVCLVFKAKL